MSVNHKMMVMHLYKLLAVVLFRNVLGSSVENVDLKFLIQNISHDMNKKFEELQTRLQVIEEQQELIISSQEESCSRELISNFLDLLKTDECLQETHPCSEMARCIDTVAHFTCTCLPGYVGDGFTCDDIDECASGALNDCHHHADCTNTPGSHDCHCRSPYFGNGSICEFDCKAPFINIPDVGCLSNPVVSGTWEEAKAVCERMDSSLFVATTTEQLRTLKRYAKEKNPKGSDMDIWVGLKDGVWLNGRVPGDEWEGGRISGGLGLCGYMNSGSRTPSYLLYGQPCVTGDAYPLCQKDGP